MSSSKKTKEAESAAKQREQAAVAAANNVKITPEAQNVLSQENKEYNAINSGNVANSSRMAHFLATMARSKQQLDEQTPTGIDALAIPQANSTALALSRDQNNRQFAQAVGEGATQEADNIRNDAASRILGVSNMDLGARSTTASLLGGRADTAWNRYTFEKQTQGRFFRSLLSGAAGAAGAYFGGGG